MAKRAADAGPSQRMLRVGEEIRHALSAAFLRGEWRDPALDGVNLTATEVRASPDLKHMTVFVAALGKPVSDELLEALKREQPHLRHVISKAVQLKYAPQLHFQPDTAPDYAMEMDRLMKQPGVLRDLLGKNEPEEPV
ncbi:ribosome-binding factor A [Humitalea rosea]|uniref:Ribosome-binding factor A n=1 Tax=Humitalea rosea TaxID=990373 RepID=A0A2W7IJ64_9PROT|nr:30S ribosome-binding factor RbfA [Humitalea rosea]PZW46969.1 ribosome-binding factor A [Humitalea rosea]